MRCLRVVHAVREILKNAPEHSSPTTISHGNQNMSSKRDISNVCGELVEHENKMNSIRWNWELLYRT